MAIPRYAYLKLKILVPAGVITVEVKAQQALDYEQDNIELAATMVVATELWELRLQVPLVSPGPAMPPLFGAFKVIEDDKNVQIDAKTLPRPFKSGPASTTNRSASSLTSSDATGTYLCRVRPKCQESPGRSPSTPSTLILAQGWLSRACNTLIRKSPKQWERSYLGF
jgi:hypothetical protein